MKSFDSLSVLYGLLAVLPLGVFAWWLMSRLERRRSPSWKDWYKSYHSH